MVRTEQRKTVSRRLASNGLRAGERFYSGPLSEHRFVHSHGQPNICAVFLTTLNRNSITSTCCQLVSKFVVQHSVQHIEIGGVELKTIGAEFCYFSMIGSMPCKNFFGWDTLYRNRIIYIFIYRNKVNRLTHTHMHAIVSHKLNVDYITQKF